MIQFLELLDARPGDRIRRCCATPSETGSSPQSRWTRWWRPRPPTTLKTVGYAPDLIAGDGTDGYPGGAPYDRVHVSCGVADIPPAWISQTRPGGLIVAPWSPGGATGHKLRLIVVDESMAVGSFHGPATYMMLRSQRQPSVWNPHHWHTVRDERGATSLLLFEASDPAGAWAACDHEPGAADFVVTQFGARRLWDEMEAAYLCWLRSGAPGRERYGITVDAAGSQMWLDNPENVIRPRRIPE